MTKKKPAKAPSRAKAPKGKATKDTKKKSICKKPVNSSKKKVVLKTSKTKQANKGSKVAKIIKQKTSASSSPTKAPKKVEQKSSPKKMVEERDTSNRKTIIIAHKGGNFGPSNSLKNYKGAIDAKCEGIEFDVSTRFAT